VQGTKKIFTATASLEQLLPALLIEARNELNIKFGSWQDATGNHPTVFNVLPG
jgi:hypothetical protein